MDPIDAQIAALEAEIAKEQAALTTPIATPTGTTSTQDVMADLPFYHPLKVEQAKRQLQFDIPVGLAKAGAGLADVLSYPVVKGLEYAGAPVETFGLSKLLGAGAEAAAPTLGVRPETKVQDIVSFLAPSPLSKAKLLGQAGTGLAAYLGSEVGQTIAPESPYAGLIGALAAPTVVSGAAKAASAIAPSLEDIGMGLQRKARGARASDYTLAKNAIIETVEGDTTTQLKKSFDNLIEEGTLGKSVDPESMYPKLEAAKEATEGAIQSVLRNTEKKVGAVPPPSFDNTLEYISKNIAADQVDKYVNQVIELQDALKREGGGSLVYLNQQKKVIGENWKNSPQSDPGFWRTLYGDMKGHIEKYAPEVKDLNKKKQDLVVVSPIIERGFKAAGAASDLGKAQQLLNTTGGAGLAGGAILGVASGSMSAGVLGALTLRALATPKGQNLVGKLSTSLGKAIPKNIAAVTIGDLTSFAGKESGLKQGIAGSALFGGAAIGLTPSSEAQAQIQSTTNIDAQIETVQREIEALRSEPTPTPKTITIGKQNISIPTGEGFAPANLVKAVMQVESAGNPNAVSVKGASGLMQLMPATAKMLGVDPTDPQQNVEGGSRYLQQQINAFDDVKLGLAAYNWGPGNIRSAISDTKSNDWETIIKRLGVRYKQNSKIKDRTGAPKNSRYGVPEETYLYVTKVLNNLDKLNNLVEA